MRPARLRRLGSNAALTAALGLSILAFAACQRAPCATPAAESADQCQIAAPAPAPGAAAGTAAATTPPAPIPGLSFDGLSPAQQSQVVAILAAQFCPCGKAQSFEDTLRHNAADCPLALPLARKVVERVRGGAAQVDIVRELTAELQRLNNRPRFTLDNRPALGPLPAVVEVVAFSDFACPFCAAAAFDAEKLVRKHGATLFFKFTPIETHPFSLEAARAALAAHRQGKFWAMHDALFAFKADLTADRIQAAAATAGLDLARFAKDRDDPAAAEWLRQDDADADRGRVEGTPTFFVGGYPVPFEELDDAIARAKAEARTP